MDSKDLIAYMAGAQEEQREREAEPNLLVYIAKQHTKEICAWLRRSPRERSKTIRTILHGVEAETTFDCW